MYIFYTVNKYILYFLHLYYKIIIIIIIIVMLLLLSCIIIYNMCVYLACSKFYTTVTDIINL